MLFTVAAHTNTRWILGMIALGCVLSTLLSMVILWVGLGLWVALTWSVYQNSKGHSSWFTQWIPKQINTLNVSWGHLSTTDSTDINPNEGDENEKSQKGLKKQDPMDESRPTTIHVYTNLMHQWWIRSAFLMLGATVLGWFSIYCGWIPGALTSLIIPCIVALLGHKQPSDPSTNRQHPDAISLSIPPETSWMGLHTWLQNHHSVLPTTGTLVFHHSTPASTIPFVLPIGFTEWTVQSQSNPIEA
jgi:hypothetical protein